MKPYFVRSIIQQEDIIDFYYRVKEEAIIKNKPCVVLNDGKCVGFINHLPEYDTEAIDFFEDYWSMKKKG